MAAKGKAAILRAYCAGHGFTQFVYVFASYPEDIVNDRAMVHMTFPGEVLDLYADGGGVQNDPVAIRVNEIQQPEVQPWVPELREEDSANVALFEINAEKNDLLQP